MTSLPSGNDPAALPQLRGWSIAAWSCHWIWAFAHGLPVWGALLLLGNIVMAWIPWEIAIWAAALTLLSTRGNQMAWSHRSFQSLEEFHATQKAWEQLWLLGATAMAVAVVVGVLVRAAYLALGLLLLP